MQPVVQHTCLLYGLGWCIGWLRFIKAVRCQAGNVCQVKKYTLYTMYTIYTMTFKFRDRKSWYEKEWKMNCGKIWLLILLLFLFVCSVKSSSLIFFWLQNLGDTLISSSSAFPFLSRKARLNLAINVNVRFEPWFILISCIDPVF